MSSPCRLRGLSFTRQAAHCARRQIAVSRQTMKRKSRFVATVHSSADECFKVMRTLVREKTSTLDWTTPGVKAGLRIHKEFVKSAAYITRLSLARNNPLVQIGFQQPQSASPGLA